jgi:hypothetical protein
MPGRRVPDSIMAYLGPCREPSSAAEKVVEQCGLGKMFGDAGLTDYDPLVVVMRLVAAEVDGLGRSFTKRGKGRKTWLEAMTMLQEDNGTLEHNTHIPCRYCNMAFEPVIDETLLALFLVWYESDATEDLLAIHRCPACGGVLKAKHTKPYEGDFHTPAPASVVSDDAWVEELLAHSSF